MPRMTLIWLGMYGDPKEPLELNLKRLFSDFKKWCKMKKVKCSQKCITVGMDTWHCWWAYFCVRWLPCFFLKQKACKVAPSVGETQVLKQNGNVCFTHKAHTGRVFCAYMAEVSTQVAEKNLDVPPGRTFGVWLKEQMRTGVQGFPADAKIELQAACMPLFCNNNWFLLWFPI